MALLKKVEWYRGDSYPLEITVKDSATEAAIDITGYSFIMTVDTEKYPTDALTKLFDVAGVLDADPTTGKVSFTPTTIDTDQDVGTYYYDIQMTDVSGNIRTIVKNDFKIVQDITK
jgi:hypothetical protein